MEEIESEITLVPQGKCGDREIYNVCYSRTDRRRSKQLRLRDGTGSVRLLEGL